ncbi:unnamed protein product [Rotaria socialis]|uniref:Glycogen debranching enzyme glucanotransferase domain-containing protein n=1 Tax=Rotaria socialis TaxID=392032 RepID=A0A821BBX1_9BILA|nr:unnamed protein product [Rotaria socialis]CAF4590159.1 unnamed protein product [Rotaria socialis]
MPNRSFTCDMKCISIICSLCEWSGLLKVCEVKSIINYFHFSNEEFKHPDDIDHLIQNDTNYQFYVMANNVWVMNGDLLRFFADENQEIYLRRDLHWSDIIRLRFGLKRKDSPALCSYMKEYTYA